jgi:hypothetical protein
VLALICVVTPLVLFPVVVVLMFCAIFSGPDCCQQHRSQPQRGEAFALFLAVRPPYDRAADCRFSVSLPSITDARQLLRVNPSLWVCLNKPQELLVPMTRSALGDAFHVAQAHGQQRLRPVQGVSRQRKLSQRFAS